MQSSNSYYSSSPTVVLPTPQQHSHFDTSDHYAPSNKPVTNRLANPFAALQNDPAPITPSPGALAGRKRSRGDIHSPEDVSAHDEDGSIPTHSTGIPSQPLSQSVNGSGMIIVRSEDSGCVADPSSQTGTGAEKQAYCTASQISHVNRPSVTSRKSQRIDSNANGPDDLAQLVVPPTLREVTQEPLIDEATRTLGISWTRMDISEARLINQAAYAKWIQNYYVCLKNVAVWFENSAIPCYLVRATNAYSGEQEFYLFSNDLTEARLVTREPAQLIPRLQALPALHLAAPGGCIHAATDPVSVGQDGSNAAQAKTLDGEVSLPDSDMMSKPHGTCAAHLMETD